MTQENNIEINQGDLDIIPLKERNSFQTRLMELMFGPDFKKKSDQEQIDIQIDWADKYATKVSDIIDHINSRAIRELIMKKDYDEACRIMIEILKKDTELNKVAA